MDRARTIRRHAATLLASVVLAVLPLAAPARAATLEQLEALLRSGEYEACIEGAREAIARGEYREQWRLLQIEAELATGRYLDAADTLETALRRYYGSLPLRWLGYRVYQQLGETRRAEELLRQIEGLVRRSPRSYNDAASGTVLGRYFLAQGADARRVLELFYDRVKKDQPQFLDAYLAAGELALEKHDYAVAAKEFEQALKIAPGNPDAQFGLARAFAPSDSERAEAAVGEALRINPRHVPTLLLVAERQIDAEQFAEAIATLDRVLAVNPESADAWAFKAVIAHLQSEPEKEGLYRRIALGWWPLNPAVDHQIGRKLSQNYRFQEGATYQRRALDMNPQYLAAKTQLSNDLLRLGNDEGWRLAAEVSQADGYNVVAHNLMQLQQRLATFVTLERPPLIIRMDPREADIYGSQVLDLLERAYLTLGPKYGVQFSEPVYIEIFPEQQDFAIRTFGLPGGEGFLGVCFGRVITANSPAALGANSTNWQSVLWHEFCHVLTLTKTANKMPRWFSEGLSVYEERQANAAWGEQMTPTYRRMILEGELTPLSQLSTSFLRPESPLHLQFAYYEASLVIEYLVERHGFESIVRILDDLGLGMAMHDSLAQRIGDLAVLDQEFAAYARERATQYAPEVDWTELPAEAVRDASGIEEWLKQHPKSFAGLQHHSKQQLAAQQWAEAREAAEQLRTLCPEFVGADNAYSLLAQAFRGAGDTPAERAVLEELAQRDDEAIDVYLRLCDLARNEEDWEAMQRSAVRAVAVNPLLPAVQQARAEAAAQLGNLQEAIEANQALLALDPVDPVAVQFRLAQANFDLGNLPAARQHVLRALEDAPRFRAAHRLLLEIAQRGAAAPATSPPASSTVP